MNPNFFLLSLYIFIIVPNTSILVQFNEIFVRKISDYKLFS